MSGENSNAPALDGARPAALSEKDAPSAATAKLSLEDTVPAGTEATAATESASASVPAEASAAVGSGKPGEGTWAPILPMSPLAVCVRHV